MAAPAAAAAAGTPAALPLAVFSLHPSLQFEFVVKGGLGLPLETKGCLNSWRCANTHTDLKVMFVLPGLRQTAGVSIF